MKKVILVGLLFFLGGKIVDAQFLNWLWAKSAVSNSFNQSTGVSADAFGNVYVTGAFGDATIVFGTDTLKNGGNFFLVKYNSSGNVIWAKSPANGQGYGRSISTDANGNVYIVGMFSDDTITFGSTALVNTNEGLEEIFLVKYDPSGNVVWAKSAGGIGEDVANSISTDIFGNVYITGRFEDASIAFGGISLINSSTANDDNMFIAKYDSAGNEVWARSAVATNFSYSADVSTDAFGGVYVTGAFGSPAITFGNDTLTYTSSNPYGFNFFLVKYDSSGAVIWARSDEETDDAIGGGVGTDASGNIYLTGTFSGSTLTFGSDTLANDNTGSGVFFLVKYDSAGTPIWAKGSGSGVSSAIMQYGQSISTDASGNIYVTGGFSYPVTFGSDTVIPGNPPSNNFFVVKYDSAGAWMWAKGSGGTVEDYSTGISTDASGNVYLTGGFEEPSLTFGNTTLTNTTNNNEGSFFLAKFDNSGITGIINVKDPYAAIKVYPNPSTGNIYFTGLQNSNTIDIYNILGEMVYSSKTDTSNHGVSLNAKAKGIYFYRIMDNTTLMQQGKIVIQ